MRIKQMYRHAGAIPADRGKPKQRFVPEDKAVTESLTLTAGQFERMGCPTHVQVIVRAADDEAGEQTPAPRGEKRHGFLHRS